jgi:hypothetical protein
MLKKRNRRVEISSFRDKEAIYIVIRNLAGETLDDNVFSRSAWGISLEHTERFPKITRLAGPNGICLDYRNQRVTVQIRRFDADSEAVFRLNLNSGLAVVNFGEKQSKPNGRVEVSKRNIVFKRFCGIGGVALFLGKNLLYLCVFALLISNYVYFLNLNTRNTFDIIASQVSILAIPFGLITYFYLSVKDLLSLSSDLRVSKVIAKAQKNKISHRTAASG